MGHNGTQRTQRDKGGHKGTQGRQETQGRERDTEDTGDTRGHRGHSELLLLYAVSLRFASFLTQYLFSACAIEPDLAFDWKF